MFVMAAALLMLLQTVHTTAAAVPKSTVRLYPEFAEIMNRSTTSSKLRAQLRDAVLAQQILLNSTNSVEADTVEEFLLKPMNGRPLRLLPLPDGAQAWCPILKQASSGQSSDEPNPASFAKVLNDKYTMKDMTWDAAMNDDLAAIAVAGVWWSKKVVPDVPVTVVTQSTVDRIPQIFAQCKCWGGPLSALAYLGLYQDTLGSLNKHNIDLLEKAAIHVSCKEYNFSLFVLT
jgi:hypothetical protein